VTKILLVEDDQNLGPSLNRLLSDEGYDVSLAASLEVARDEFSPDYNVVILDWMLPDGQGVDFLKDIRAKNLNLPVIMLTAKTELIDKVLGLESGANDYMTKPFEPRELLARIRVQLRTAEVGGEVISEEKTLEVSGVSIDPLKREVSWHGELVDLTKMEYELLKLLAESPNRVFSRDEILNKVWGYENFPSTRTVDTHVLQLRQKFSDELIETIRGIGYRLRKIES
jgi:DNA-binding response OmpR family regulator